MHLYWLYGVHVLIHNNADNVNICLTYCVHNLHFINGQAIHVSKSDILRQIYFFSDNENLVSFKRAIFVDYSLEYKINMFLLFM